MHHATVVRFALLLGSPVTLEKPIAPLRMRWGRRRRAPRPVRADG